METAAAEEDDWPDQVRSALAAFLEYAVANPAVARTCIVSR